MNSYTPTERSRVKRLHQRAKYDRESVFAILDAALLCHVGYVIEGQPYVTATAFWREGDTLYWHGSAASRMLRTVETGVLVCFTAALLDGLVLARSGFHSSMNYRSVTAFGTAHALKDETAKDKALLAFSEKLHPGRWDEIRPSTSQELKGTTVVAMEIEEAVAKARSGPPNDDEEDYAMDVWAGVIPVRTVIGAPEDDPRLKPGIASPDYLKRIRIG